MDLPFAHLNLRYNPFGETELADRPALAIVDLGETLNFLAAPRAAVQFIGEKGFGKTTHLLACRARVAQGIYIRMPEEGRLPPIPDAPWQFVDEVQRLGRWRRRRLFAGGGRLVLGTHVDYAGELKRAGRPVLTIELGRALHAETVRQIAERRIECARRSTGPVPTVTMATVRALLDQHGPDIRSIEQSLYDRFQQLREIGDV